MKKKIMAVVLAATLLTGLAACGNESTQNPVTTGEQTSADVAEDTTKADTNESTSEENTDGADTIVQEGETGKTLVVYYSASGNTKEVANVIAQEVGGDLFELVPVEIYTDDDLNWTDSDSRVSVEHDNPDSREVELVADTVENWDEYDTIYVGYPIWWGIAAWPVDDFVESNDFSGKTVITFATAASSGMGESSELLEAMAKTGDWIEGECFRGSTSDDDIKEWVQSVGR